MFKALKFDGLDSIFIALLHRCFEINLGFFLKVVRCSITQPEIVHNVGYH